MPSCDQSLYPVFEHQKCDLLAHLLTTGNFPSTLVFLRSRDAVHELTAALNRAELAVESVHGTTKPQAREEAISALKAGRLRVVVATNAVLQEFDLSGISQVIYYDYPEHPNDFIAHLATAEQEVAVFSGQNDQKLLDKLEAALESELPRREAEGFAYDDQPKYTPPVRSKGYKANKVGSKPLQHKKPKLIHKGPRRKTGRTRKR